MDYKHFIELSLSQGVRLSVGESIKDGFNMAGKNAGPYIGYTIVMFFISMSAAFIPIVGGILTSVLLSPALLVGYAMYARKVDVEGKAPFETFFDGFKSNYGQLIIVNLIIQLIVMGLSSIFLVSIFSDMAPLFTEMMDAASDPEYMEEIMQEVILTMLASFRENWWLFAIYIILTLIIQVLYMLANYFVVFYGFGFWEAMESSRKLMSKVFVKAIIIMIIAGFIMLVGSMVTLGFGFLFFYPFLVLVYFSIFKQVAGFSDENAALEDELNI